MFAGFDEVCLEELFDIGEAVVDLGADLGEGDAFFVAPGLGCSLGDFHDLDELGIVDEGLVGGELLYSVVDLLDACQECLKLVFGDDDCFHVLLCLIVGKSLWCKEIGKSRVIL